LLVRLAWLAPACPTDNAGCIDQRSGTTAAKDRQLAIPALNLLVADQLGGQALREILVRLGLRLGARQRGRCLTRGLRLQRICVTCRLSDILLGLDLGLGQLVFLLLGLLRRALGCAYLMDTRTTKATVMAAFVVLPF
jgi:hypothetical protein